MNAHPTARHYTSCKRARVAACIAVGFILSNVAAAEEPTITRTELVRGQLLAPKAFRAAANRVLPSLVTIEAFGGVSSGQGRIGGIKRRGEGPTTGLVISKDGYILTSTFNFIRRPPVITVVLRDGTRHVAKLLGRDDTRKLCLLKVEGVDDLAVPELVPRGELKVGQWAVSVGVGYGDSEPAVSAGIISATSRISGRAVQTDANISPANYGGPLVDIQGRVIGICSPLSPQSQETGSGVEWYDSGIGFAIPLHNQDKLIAALKKGEQIQAGYLGVQVKNNEGGGCTISKVQKGTAAESAKLKEGDIILKVDGVDVLDPAQLKIAIARHVAGEEISLTIEREEAEIEVKAKLLASPQKEAKGKQIPQLKLPDLPIPGRSKG